MALYFTTGIDLICGAIYRGLAVCLNAVCLRYMPFAGTQGVAHSADGFDWHKPQLKIMSGKEIAPAQAEHGSKVVSLPDTNNVVWAGGTSLTVSSDHSDLHDYKYVGGMECNPQDHMGRWEPYIYTHLTGYQASILTPINHSRHHWFTHLSVSTQ